MNCTLRTLRALPGTFELNGLYDSALDILCKIAASNDHQRPKDR